MVMVVRFSGLLFSPKKYRGELKWPVILLFTQVTLSNAFNLSIQKRPLKIFSRESPMLGCEGRTQVGKAGPFSPRISKLEKWGPNTQETEFGAEWHWMPYQRRGRQFLLGMREGFAEELRREAEPLLRVRSIMSYAQSFILKNFKPTEKQNGKHPYNLSSKFTVLIFCHISALSI